MNYYLDDQLIAVGVIDIVPQGMSSVYFFYDPIYKPLKLGIVAGLYEIEYIKRMNKSFSLFKYYYLGFYIQESDKMRYKGDFEPSELLCPKTRRFVELTEKVRQYIKDNRKYLDDDPIDQSRWNSIEFAN